MTRIRQLDTHRLIPSKYSVGGKSVLVRVANDNGRLPGVLRLEHATRPRMLAENDRLPGIGIAELVFGFSYYHVINASFSRANLPGSRFNGPDRGAWYAGFELETSQAEVAWHKWIEFAEIGTTKGSVTYDDYLADFGGEYHDIRKDPTYQECLAPDSYVESQLLAETLLQKWSSGIIYPSVRHSDGICLACFRPALVGNVRKSARYRFTWTGSPWPDIKLVKTYP